jgi:hypothetical protein
MAYKKKFKPEKATQENIQADIQDSSHVNNSINKTSQLNPVVSDKFLKWSCYYAISGSPDIATEKSGYEREWNQTKLIETYKAYNLPEPPDPSATNELIGQIVRKLPTSEIADLVVKSATTGDYNRMLERLIDLYLDRERKAQVEQWRALDVDQRFRWAIEETEILSIIAEMLCLQTAPQCLESLPFWHEVLALQGPEKLQEYKALIDKALGNLSNDAYIDKRDLAEETKEVAVPIPKKRGRPPKARPGG